MVIGRRTAMDRCVSIGCTFRCVPGSSAGADATIIATLIFLVK